MSEYKRLTDRVTAVMLKNTEGSSWDSEDMEAQRYIRLAELENKIEQGTLVELPCKVGEVVYQIDNGGEIYEAMILDIAIRKGKPYYETCGVDFDNTAIGQSVFLTREEAEKRLKELGNGKERCNYYGIY